MDTPAQIVTAESEPPLSAKDVTKELNVLRWFRRAYLIILTVFVISRVTDHVLFAAGVLAVFWIIAGLATSYGPNGFDFLMALLIVVPCYGISFVPIFWPFGGLLSLIAAAVCDNKLRGRMKTLKQQIETIASAVVPVVDPMPP